MTYSLRSAGEQTETSLHSSSGNQPGRRRRANNVLESGEFVHLKL